ncbi:hypothetical protein [Desulfonema magnum]|nr:hypothetical protein [Desulfonema magnum]
MSSKQTSGIRCPHCSEGSHPVGTEFCPNTGKPLKKKSSKIIVVSALTVVFVAVAAFVAFQHFGFDPRQFFGKENEPDPKPVPHTQPIFGKENDKIQEVVTESPDKFQIGERVRVKKSVTKPCQGWGEAKPAEIYTVIEAGFRDKYLKVTLPSGRKWIVCPEDVEKIE